MQLNLPDVEVLSYNQESTFFDSSFRFGNKKTLTVKGKVLDLPNAFGVSGVTSGIWDLRQSLNQNYQNVVLNGYNFGQGKVVNLSIPDDFQVKWADYTVSFEIFNTGNLWNFTGHYYSGAESFTGIWQSPHLLTDFSEEFSFENSTDNYSYTHSVNIQYTSGINDTLSPIDRAKGLAQILLTGNVDFGFLDSSTSGLYSNNYRKTYNESYDLVNNNCSFEENFSSFNGSGNYSLILKNNLSLDENGITTVSENAQIKNYIKDNNSLGLNLNQEITNSFSRCQNLYNERVNGGYGLNDSPITLEKNINTFEDSAEYSITFDDSPRTRNNYLWEYTHSISKNGAYFDVVEEGTIIGVGENLFVKNANAKDAFESVITGVQNRVSGYYKGQTNLQDPIFLVEQKKAQDHFLGTIGYGSNYTDNPDFGIEGFVSLESQISDNVPRDYFNKFNIFNQKEMVQSINTTTQGSRTLSLSAVTKRGDSFTGILYHAKNKINSYIPQGNDVFLNSCNYSYNPFGNIANFNVTWLYNRGDTGILVD